MTHDELARDLAGHLRGTDRMVWTDMQLGAAGSPRPDVYAIYKSYIRPHPVAYEVKVSISDYRSDVTSGKWQSYLKYATGIYFACESGLLTKNLVPDQCGLIIRYDSSWRVAKKPVLQRVDIPQSTWLKLLIDGVEREGPVHRVRRFNESQIVEHLSKKFGELVGRTIRDCRAVEYENEASRREAKRIVEEAQRERDRIRVDVDSALAQLREIMGVADADIWTLRQEISKLRADRGDHPAQRKWRDLTQSVRRALEYDGYKEGS